MAERVIQKINAIIKRTAIKGIPKVGVRVAAYARVSTDSEEQETSLIAQEDYYRKKILEHPGWLFVKIYIDHGISGLSINRRAQFNRMIEDCLAGQIDLILTKSISRFARNTVDTITIVRKLKEKGIGVYFEKENIYTLDSKGEFILTLMSSLAQEESRSMSENIAWGIRKSFSDGKVKVPYKRFLGYDRGDTKGTMVVNCEQAVIVRRIFRMYMQGYTARKIAKTLASEGVVSPGGLEHWRGGTVLSILSNEKYKGDALLQKVFTVDYLQKKLKKNEGELPQYYVEGSHEAIISPWLFDYIQEIKRYRDETYGNSYLGKELLQTKFVCGECGSLLCRRDRYYPNGKKRVWWQCKTQTQKEVKSCGVKYEYEPLIIYAVLDMARCMTIKRMVEDTILSAMSKEKRGIVKEWLSAFEVTNAENLLWVEEEILMIVRSIKLTSNRILEFEWIDDSQTKYKLPRYAPAKGILDNDVE
jgi:DNA invertase Pin-like site-specific DNA recombinase